MDVKLVFLYKLYIDRYKKHRAETGVFLCLLLLLLAEEFLPILFPKPEKRFFEDCKHIAVDTTAIAIAVFLLNTLHHRNTVCSVQFSRGSSPELSIQTPTDIQMSSKNTKMSSIIRTGPPGRNRWPSPLTQGTALLRLLSSLPSSCLSASDSHTNTCRSRTGSGPLRCRRL